MSYNVPDADHFEGGANLTRGADQAAGDEKLADYLRKFRTGSVTATGAGTESAVIDPPFEDANYVVVFGPDTLATTPEWANKAVAGFDIVVAAAGSVDWVAIHD